MSVARAKSSQSAIESISSFLNRECGLVFSADKVYLFEQRLPPILALHGLGSMNALAHELQSNIVLRRAVIHQMTTHETSFFRDFAHFNALRTEVLPEVWARAMKRSPSGDTRGPAIWASACSTGQEPYSLAMLLKERGPITQRTPPILATDISHDVIARAERGYFSQLEVNRGLSPERLASFFRADSSGFQIEDELRRMIEFRPMNLARPFAVLDEFELVLCRNVLIYFSKETAKLTIDRIAQRQPRGGYLMLGASERLYAGHEAYQEVTISGVLFYRRR